MKPNDSTAPTTPGQNWVHMSDQDRELFSIFQENVHMFTVMLNAGVFNPPMSHASQIILHFNQQGQLAKIDRNQILFVRGR